MMELDIDNLNTHILVVDDTKSIHDDFDEILDTRQHPENHEIKDLEDFLFQDDPQPDREKSTDELEKTEKFLNLTYTLDHAFQGEEAVEIVRKREGSENPVSVIVMDVRMPPGINGIEAILRIWKINPYIEIVICSAYSDYSWDQIVDLVGATDRLLFLKKPFHSIEVRQMILSLVIKWNYHKQNRHFISHLEHEVEQRTNQIKKLNFELEATNKELEGKNRQLAEMALKDGMTGLFNHMAFQNHFNDIFEDSRLHSFPICISMIDIDLFKSINDSYGHAVGDKVIIAFADVITQCLEDLSSFSSCIAGRYGGDEFALIMPYFTMQKAKKLLDKICSEVKTITIEQIPDLTITASLGGACLDSETVCPGTEELIQCADAALYTAKKEGRDQVRINMYDYSEE